MIALERLCRRYAQALARRIRRTVDFALVSYSDVDSVIGVLRRVVSLAMKREKTGSTQER